MKVVQLKKEEYAGIPFTVQYSTNGFYDICKTDSGFEIRYKSFDETVLKGFSDTLLSDWLQNPIAYGVFDDDILIGYVEGFLESWNNRFRISNICVFNALNRHKGVGAFLLKKITDTAKDLKARMIVLETQSCNEKAISFYKKHDFEIIGFDLYAYSNEDLIKHEIRIEMGKRI